MVKCRGIMSPVPERPFGVLVDTRLPTERLSVRFVKPFDIQPDPNPTRSDWWIDSETFRAAFRNAEAAEASE